MAAPPPPPSYFQLSYAGVNGCGNEDVSAGIWCAAIDPTALGADPRSDMLVQACDAADYRQLFSYDEGSKLLAAKVKDPGVSHESCNVVHVVLSMIDTHHLGLIERGSPLPSIDPFTAFH